MGKVLKGLGIAAAGAATLYVGGKLQQKTGFVNMVDEAVSSTKDKIFGKSSNDAASQINKLANENKSKDFVKFDEVK